MPLPNQAAIITSQFPNQEKSIKAKNVDAPNITIATPKLAPELIPRIYGPASGFLKIVCICTPEIDKPAPTKIAVIAFGILNSDKTIF